MSFGMSGGENNQGGGLRRVRIYGMVQLTAGGLSRYHEQQNDPSARLDFEPPRKQSVSSSAKERPEIRGTCVALRCDLRLTTAMPTLAYTLHNFLGPIEPRVGLGLIFFVGPGTTNQASVSSPASSGGESTTRLNVNALDVDTEMSRDAVLVVG